MTPTTAADAAPIAARAGTTPRARRAPALVLARVHVRFRWLVVAVAFVLLALAGASNPLSAAGGSEPSAATAPSVLATGGAGLDVFDLVAKGLFVLALLFVTLRLLGRYGGSARRREGRLQVLESRPLAAKASLHLVAVGDRRLVVGLSPSGMVALAELDAEELPEPDLEPQVAAGVAPLGEARASAVAAVRAVRQSLPFGGRLAALIEGRAR